MKKIFWKAINIIVRTITYLASILFVGFGILLAFAYSQGLPTEIPLIVCIPCLAWLVLMGVLFILEKKFSI